MSELIMLCSLGGYILLCALIARYKFETQEYFVPTLGTLFFTEVISGFILYPLTSVIGCSE